MKFKLAPRLIPFPIQNWAQMAGANDLQKKLNALFTERLVTNEAPADECLSEAEMVDELTRGEEPLDSAEPILVLLAGAFATTPEGDSIETRRRGCIEAAKQAWAVVQGAWPPVYSSETPESLEDVMDSPSTVT